METNDNTLREMQQQMQQLREMLNDQKIINENLLRNACSRRLDRIRFKSRIPYIAGVAAILSLGSFYSLGMSTAFLIYSFVIMLVCIVATAITNSHLPRLDRDLVSAGEELVKFKRIHTEWLKYSLPVLAVWIGWLIYEIGFGPEAMEKEMLYPMLCGICVGVAVGLILGLKNRRDVLDSTDDILAQIEELRKGE